MKPTVTRKVERVSKLYAKALFELAQEKNQLDEVHQDLAGFVELLETQPQLRSALTAFAFPVEARLAMLNELNEKLQVGPVFTRFAQLLMTKGRMQLLSQVNAAFLEYVDESKNIVRGTLTTVEPLTEAESADLSKAFSRKLNKQVVLDSIIDKEILGGLIVKIQGLTFDGSLKTTIHRLKENLERQSI